MTMFLDLREDTILIVRQISYVSFASLSEKSTWDKEPRMIYKG